ncbi:MAG: SDR family oxidoreductase, partial [Promethearchaeota archaeon]
MFNTIKINFYYLKYDRIQKGELIIRNKIVLFTGFPGFIGRRLLKELIKQNKNIEIYALIIKSVKEKADKTINEDSLLKDKVKLIIGDISKPKLGLISKIYTDLTKKITDIFHLAAIYHLEVPKKLAWDVNVIGTYNMIKFALKCSNLFCFIHFSSIVAPGRKQGKIMEDELDSSVSLHENHYEITKHVSEYLVRKYDNRIPLIIIRPAIVIGESTTGITEKFDGIYPIFELGKGGKNLGRFIPRIQIKNSKLKVPLVPVDYIAKTVAYISDQEACIGHTFHLGSFDMHINHFIDIIFAKTYKNTTIYIPNNLLDLIMHSPLYRYLIRHKIIKFLSRKGFQLPVEIL